MKPKLVPPPIPQCDLARALKAELAYQQTVVQLCKTRLRLGQVQATLDTIALQEAEGLVTQKEAELKALEPAAK